MHRHAPSAPDATPVLPAFDAGLHVLSTPEPMPGAVQSLALDHVLGDGAEGLWIDSKGMATTNVLTDVAPSMTALERLHVARAFTPFQHASLLADAPASAPEDTGIVVVPAVDAHYRDGDVPRGEAERMLEHAAGRLVALRERLDVPVLVTLAAADDLVAPVLARCDRRVTCERTPLGPRFSGDGVETLLYPGDGYVQTTLAYWRRVLAARHPTVAASPDAPEVTAGGTH